MKSEQQLFIKNIKCANVVYCQYTRNVVEMKHEIIGQACVTNFCSRLCKVVESMLRDEVLNYVNLNNLFTADQHGFTKKRSCLTNSLETFEEWTEAL